MFIRPLIIQVISVLFCGNMVHAIDRFPAIEPYTSGMLQVSDIHSIYWEESGNPNGVPVLFIHGGPGAGTNPKQRTFFDPTYYRIILFDQRGCGKSVPYGSLIENTTWDLVEDIEKLRQFLLIDRFFIFGGSWGTTLGLTYAIKHAENVLGLVLRGVFLCTEEELDWFYKEGGSKQALKTWKKFIELIPPGERHDPIGAYHYLLASGGIWTRSDAAATWVLWELANMFTTPEPRLQSLLDSRWLYYAFMILYAKQNYVMASIENHYFFHRGFFETNNWILENIHRIENVPGVIIQGENDQICPWEHARIIHEAWPASTFLLVPNAGHSAEEHGTLDTLLHTMEQLKTMQHI